MAKCRPLNAAEAQAMQESTHHVRDRCLLTALHRTGYRVGELASLCVGDVYDFASKTIKPRVQVKKAKMKKGVSRMAIPIHAEWRAALVLWLAMLQEQDLLKPNTPLWLSRKSATKLQGLAPQSIWRLVRQAALRAGVDPDRVGCHSYRKLFAAKMYADTGGHVEKVRRILGHTQLSSTQQYLESITSDAELEAIILAAA
jgi:integrase/recombinase XerD